MKRLYLLLIILIILLLIELSSDVGSQHLIGGYIAKHKVDNIDQFSEHYTIVKNGGKVVDNKTDYTTDITKKDPGQNTGFLNDPLFKDVVFYENDNIKYNPDGTYEGDTGYEKCRNGGCNGRCVEYGITGNAYCFPKSKIDDADPYTKSLQKLLPNNLNKGV